MIKGRKSAKQMSLRAVDLSVSADDRLIISDVSIHARPGEPLFLLGPNGSGKSTLLKGIVGLPSYKVVRGKILLGDVDVTGLPAWERVRMGLCLVHQTVSPLTVPTYFLLEKIKERGRGPEDVMEVLGRLRIQHLYYRPAFQGFSGGESKKLEIATAVISNSSYILLDEPDSGVDVDSLKVISEYVNRWIDEGRVIVIVTHTGTIHEFIKRDGRAYVLVNGRVAYEGHSSEVIELVVRRGYTFFSGG